MKKGKYESAVVRKRKHSKLPVVLVSLILVLGLVVGSTFAYMHDESGKKTNTFQFVEVSCEIEEVFDGQQKTSIKVQNTGDTDAFIRVKLVSYRVNEAGDRIGGTATVPAFTLAAGWFQKDGYYYYNTAVEAGAFTPEMLGSPITLVEYDDADGGKQVIEVMAEAIQAGGPEGEDAAAALSWGVTVSGDKIS